MPKYTYTPRRKVERIVIQGSVFMRCPICGRNVHLRYVGLRVMPDGTVRNQPRCGKCRKEKA